MRKEYVDVYAIHHSESKVVMPKIIWKDGRKFKVDHADKPDRVAALKVGGTGLRYKVTVSNEDEGLISWQTYIWLEDDGISWFVEARD